MFILLVVFLLLDSAHADIFVVHIFVDAVLGALRAKATFFHLKKEKKTLNQII